MGGCCELGEGEKKKQNGKEEEDQKGKKKSIGEIGLWP